MAEGGFDIVVLSDVIYSPALHAPLLETLAQLQQAPGFHSLVFSQTTRGESPECDPAYRFYGAAAARLRLKRERVHLDEQRGVELWVFCPLDHQRQS